MTIYENVKKACEENGTTVMALEQKLGFARGYIYKWTKINPGIDKIKKVADELSRPIEYFLTNVDLHENGKEDA